MSIPIKYDHFHGERGPPSRVNKATSSLMVAHPLRQGGSVRCGMMAQLKGSNDIHIVSDQPIKCHTFSLMYHRRLAIVGG